MRDGDGKEDGKQKPILFSLPPLSLPRLQDLHPSRALVSSRQSECLESR